MKFLGATWPRLEDWVREAIGQAARSHPGFETALTEVGVFPSPGRTRVVWVGLSDPEGSFAAIAGTLNDLLAEHFEPEKRAFTPHLTLARARERAGAPLPELPPAPDLAPWTADEMVLYESRPTGQGPPLYLPIECFRLA